VMPVQGERKKQDGVEYEVVALGRDRFLGKVDTQDGTIVFMLNDQGAPDDGWGKALCRISNISACARTIPKGTPKAESKVLLERCLRQKCGSRGGDGPIVVF